MTSALHKVLDGFKADDRRNAVTESVLCLRIHLADSYRKRHGDSWSRAFALLFQLLAQQAERLGGQLSTILADGAVARFATGGGAMQAAIEIQEFLDRQPESEAAAMPRCAIGIATGEILAAPVQEGCMVLMGRAVEMALHLCDGASPGAVLLAGTTFLASDLTTIGSLAGRQERRPARAYFLDLPHRLLAGFAEPVEIHSLFWQAEEERGVAERPYQIVRSASRRLEEAIQEESANARARLFGRVGTIKQERGFGFIQYYTEDDEYREIYFHIAYVIDRVPIREGDHVEFVIKPGKGGRPQACSILVMGGRIQGQVEEFDDEVGVGSITIRDHDSEMITFHIFRREVRNEEVRTNDIVEFTVASGSESEGLVALDVRLYGGRHASPHVGTGDNLRIGHSERAVVTTYSAEKGYGFAKCRRNSIYVHVSELVDPEQIPNQGDLIEFEVSPGRNGTYRATDVRLVARRAELVHVTDPALLTSCS